MPTQSTNVSGGQFGIKFTGPGLTWTVLSGVTVHGTTAGVYSEFANSVLINSGAISSTFGSPQVGVYFDPSGANGAYVVENRAGGSIAALSGIVIDGFAGSARVDNEGNIGNGETGVQIGGAGAIAIENSGAVSGNAVGILLFADGSGFAGPTIENRGKISGGQYAISIDGDNAATAKVSNLKSGLIESDGIALSIFFNSALRLLFENDGKVTGYVIGGPNSDKVVNTGKIAGDVFLSGGNDVFQSKGKASAGKIDSGPGNDKITLGDKNDKLLFDSALNAQTNVDRIKNFTSGKDKMYLDNDIFVGLHKGALPGSAFAMGKKASDPKDRIIYDKKSGAAYFDADGAGGAKQVQFATLDKNTKLKASDFVAGEFSLFA
jgi:Ca2+-binding RTX toxin-like protein